MFSNKEETHHNQSNQDGIYISKKEASVGIALSLVLGILLFVVGYFWGKQSVIDGFKQKTTHESFNDQIDYLLTMQSFSSKNDSSNTLKSTPADKYDESNEKQATTEKAESITDTIAVEKSKTKPTPAVKKVASPTVADEKYRAILIGFGSRATANQFAARLKKHGIHVLIKARVGKTASGKISRTWFQAITKNYSSKEDLQTVVDKIKRLEHIKSQDIQIMQIK